MPFIIEIYRSAFKLRGEPEVNLMGSDLNEAKTMYRQGPLFTTWIRYIKETIASLAYRASNRH